MRVLLVYPDYAPAQSRWESPLGFYSEGLASIAAMLRLGGHEVAMLHFTSPVGKSRLEKMVRHAGPDVIAFATRSGIFPDTVRYAAWAREAAPGAFTVAGGYHATVVPEKTLAAGFDALIRGEAERAMLELCAALEKGAEWRDLAGLWFLDGGRPAGNPNGPVFEDLDLLPTPHFELFELESLESYHLKTAQVMVSRGCPYRCTYCCNQAFRSVYPDPGKYVRFRSPAGAVSYIRQMLGWYGNSRYVIFLDDILPLNRNWFQTFMKLYREQIGLPFACNARANLLTGETVAILKESGCFRVHIGVESGDDEVRNSVLKRAMSRETIAAAFATCHQAGLGTLSYNMVGLPGEGPREILKTIKLNAGLSPNRVLASVFYPYPGTELHRLAVERVLVGEEAYGEDAYLDQPQLSRAEAMFASTFFRLFLRLYRLARRFPPRMAAALEGWIDEFFCWRGKPHLLMVRVARAVTLVERLAKNTAKRHLSFYYLWVRDRSLGKRTMDGSRGSAAIRLLPGLCPRVVPGVAALTLVLAGLWLTYRGLPGFWAGNRESPGGWRLWSGPRVEVEKLVIPVDVDGDGIYDLEDIVQGARQEAEARTRYSSAYYAGGYPPDGEGACTDVIWRALRNAGYDCKQMLDEDIRLHLSDYPRVGGAPDPNIDFRRVPNLAVLFKKKATVLTTEIVPGDVDNLKEWQGGDIVVFAAPHEHIGIVSDRRRPDGVPLLIHNPGPWAVENDSLLSWPSRIQYHFRFPRAR